MANTKQVNVPGWMANADIMMGVGVMAIIGIMILPIPTLLLDLFLSISITVSVIILMVAMYVLKPLEFSVFPSVLLLTTLFRLALNVASTRLILMHGAEGVDAAGQVIKAFGNFVVGGNFAVGFIVFLILIIINFMVITKGAGRIAEVGARFTLDAMPGKQMSIDADLNAGLINDQEARQRRRDVERQADFYGAMDGASKFVKGDAIASIIITVINVIGGFVVGMAQQGLPWSEALGRYTLLTVGDGLVTQIPALLIATATGVIVTKAASEANLASDLASQILKHPRALGVTAGAMLILGLMPGLPKLPFFLMALFLGFLSFNAWRVEKEEASKASAATAEAPEVVDNTPGGVSQLLNVDPLEIELGYGLVPLADPARGGDLMERVGMIRRQLALDLGFVTPLVRVRDNMQVTPNTYIVKLRGVEIARGELLPERLLALDPTGSLNDVTGIEAHDPAFGLPAKWISPPDRDQAELAGYTVVEPAAVLVTHVTHLIKANAYLLIGRQETKNLLDAVKETAPVLIDELIPNVLTTGDVQKVLQNLLREGVPIRDLVSILEALADWAPATKDPERLTERVRQALAMQITRDLPVQDGRLVTLALDPALENDLARLGEAGQQAGGLVIDPEVARRALQSLDEEARRVMEKGQEPVVVCSPVVRLFFKRLTERVVPNLKVVSFNEIRGDVQIEVVGMVKG